MAAPELRLSVGLDLEFFREQMRKAVNIAQSEFTAQLNVKINRRVLDSELNHVSRMFARRDFRLQVNDTSIKAARLNAQKLKNTLDTIAKTKYAINVQGPPAGGFAQTPVGAAGLFEYMRTQGLSGGGGATAVGRTARIQKALEDLSVKQLQALAKQEGITGYSRLRKTPLIEKMMTGLSQLAMERILGNAQMMLQSPFPHVATTGVSGRTLGARVSGQMPMGGSLPMLPAAGQTAAFSMGTMPSNLRQPSMPSESMMGPSSQLGKGYFAGGKLAASLRELDPVLRQTKVPLAGAIEELGGQFAQATKQVLLYGTAYKALAFFLDLPRQAFEATKAVQLFENQIRAITGSAEEADRAFNFVDNLSERFALPLQSARQGFAQLYASMSPAGIPAGDIETLFEGMANAAATFGFSAAEMDRMTLAFSQMASKGKIMTEEVTRQLGDVLPGALGLMARAAQMEIADFIDAMQKGQLSGEAMKAVMFNIGIIMQQEFGEGAQNAAVLLRGAMNEMSNAVLRMYEAFRPLIEALAAEAIPMITEAVKSATAGIRVFVASITGSERPVGDLNGIASTVAQTLQSLAEILKALTTIAQGLGPTFGLLGQAILSILEQIARFINTPVGEFLANVAAKTLLLTAAFQMLIKLGLIQAIAGLVQFITNTRAAIFSLQMLIATSRTAQLALISLGAGVVITALSTLVGKLNEVYSRMLDIQRGAQNAAQAIAGMSQTEATLAARRYQNQITTLERFERETKGKGGFISASAEEINAIAAAGGTPGVAFAAPLVDKEKGIYGAGSIDPTQAAAAIQQLKQLESQARFQARPVQSATSSLRPITLEGGKDEAKAGRELKDFYNDQSKILQAQLEGRLKDLELRKQAINMSQTEYEIEKAQIELTHQRLIISESLRVALAQAAKENLSASDKQLKIDGLREQATLDLANAEKQSVLDIGKARLSLENTIEDSVLNTRLEMEEQKQMLSALSGGYESLSSDVRAYLDVQKLTAKMSQFEVSLVKDKIEAYAALREELYRLEQQAAPARMERELRGRLLLAGSIAPADELRARLRQELEYASPDRVEEIARLTEQVEAAEQLKERMQGIASSIGDSFGEAFKNIITGTSSVQESLAGMFRSIADSFADMVSEMISQWLRAQVIGLFKNIFSGFSGGLGSGVDRNASILSEMNKYATGGIAFGGFKAFASGGIVTGPTLGLVGEGRYNEAIVPLPDGKSIPVDLGGLPAGGGISTNIVVNVSNGQASSQTSGSQGNQLARELEGAVRQVILKETRPGGVIYSAR